MNYQNKYFKYKSKYLYLKSGNTSVDKHKLEFRFKFKIDDENILDYQHKYLKYKSKYLALKYGGTDKSRRAWEQFSTTQIRKQNGRVYTNNIQNDGPSTPDEEAFANGIKERNSLEKKKKISDNNQKNKKKTDADNKTRKELEAIRLENRTKLLKKLEEILNNIPYDKKLVNCQVNKCECCVCNKCNIGVNDIKDEKEEKEWCKDGVFKNCRCEKCICIGGNEIPSFLSRINKKICPCIDDNSNIKLRSTMFGKEIYCPIKYKYTSNIKNLIESEINKSEYNKIFDNNKISKENIRILLKKPIDEAAKQNFINSEKKEELIEYIITKLKNNMGSIYV